MEEKKPAGTDADIEAGKGLAWLSYLGILFLVPMFASKDNKFSQFHARQGMVLCIVWVAWWLLMWILTFIFVSLADPYSYGTWSGLWALVGILGIISFLGYIYLLIMAIIGLIKSATGKYWRMPIFGGFVNKEGYPV